MTSTSNNLFQKTIYNIIRDIDENKLPYKLISKGKYMIYDNSNNWVECSKHKIIDDVVKPLVAHVSASFSSGCANSGNKHSMNRIELEQAYRGEKTNKKLEIITQLTSIYINPNEDDLDQNEIDLFNNKILNLLITKECSKLDNEISFFKEDDIKENRDDAKNVSDNDCEENDNYEESTDDDF